MLILTYVAGLWFSLRTHRDLFNRREATADEATPRGAGRWTAEAEEEGEPWSIASILALAGAVWRSG